MYTYLFASSESSGLGALIVLVFLAIGFRKIVTTISRSPTARDGAKDAALNLLGRIFKK